MQGDGRAHFQLVSDTLSRCLGIPLHTLFQVSTSGALVQGVYERAVSSNLLLNYGDFGLGTFENLDGEMVVLDGAIYQVRSDGKVAKIEKDVGTPFAVVTHFVADQDQMIDNASSFKDLTKICDRYRDSDNLFYAFRIDGHFGHVHTRAMRETLEGLPLAKLQRFNRNLSLQVSMEPSSASGLRSFRALSILRDITSTFFPRTGRKEAISSSAVANICEYEWRD